MVRCTNCGLLLAQDDSLAPPDGRPCAQCGSPNRTYAVMLPAAQVRVLGGLVDVEVIDYPRSLLDEAGDLIGRGQFGIAIVVAHMACEVAVQRALSLAFETRNIADLEDPMSAYFSGFNLGNDRLRALYTALTDDRIQEQPFWNAFKSSAARRNRIVHNGETATKTEANESHEAATAFVEHVTAHRP